MILLGTEVKLTGPILGSLRLLTSFQWTALDIPGCLRLCRTGRGDTEFMGDLYHSGMTAGT